DAGGARAAAFAGVGGEERHVSPQARDGRLAVERGGEGAKDDEKCDTGKEAARHQINPFRNHSIYSTRDAAPMTLSPTRKRGAGLATLACASGSMSSARRHGEWP